MNADSFSSDEFHSSGQSDDDPPFPEHLPPVEPPSAGFIVQLFVVPALIVSVILGVYLLFGQLAASDLDWRQQVVDVRSDNPHIRWRGALGLAQMLDADAQRGDRSQQLARNPEVAAALVQLFQETLEESPRDDEVQMQLEFLTKALGRLDVPETVLSVLLDVATDDEDEDLQKHALTAVAMVAGRAWEHGRPSDDADLVQRIISVSESGNPLARHQAAFILGLLDSPEATGQLDRMINDPDLMTRANAAIGLARANSLDGLPVFEEVLLDAVADPLDGSAASNDADAEMYFERTLLLSNSLKAIARLCDQFTAQDRSRIAKLVERVADVTQDERLRVQARDVGGTLQSAG